jgi:hypothetical protein
VDAATWLTVAAVVLVALLAWTAWTLTRLRRLAGRVARARTALDAQLQRRAELAAVLAADHAEALGAEAGARLRTAAGAAREPVAGDRELVENELGRSLRALPPGLPGVPTGVRADLQDCATRVGLARRFYNDAVRDTRALRRGRFTRALRLHARRPLPRYFDIDDGIDAGSPWPAGVVRSHTPGAPPGRSAPR